jgi:hypothetical protein
MCVLSCSPTRTIKRFVHMDGQENSKMPEMIPWLFCFLNFLIIRPIKWPHPDVWQERKLRLCLPLPAHSTLQNNSHSGLQNEDKHTCQNSRNARCEVHKLVPCRFLSLISSTLSNSKNSKRFMCRLLNCSLQSGILHLPDFDNESKIEKNIFLIIEFFFN